ncbi:MULTISPECIES: hypothetical protein [Ralstonia solanacearum species complex]|uniref:hypothetical protein n=1 Tax=Ralstonia solanacearum species complex TaxID=3116862 RepID=UPI0004D66154|nr:hypothetical protein [Ralstonia solanacearum]ATI29145.1 hypothetical protein CCY86_16540 [Ralstonia solanacearum]KEI30914.1 hypothetical protein CQ06_02370 [Ralstonia solanacearum]KFX81540.1 hypothetical protein KR99_22515 [Ralstonia solanacearum]KFZ92097.1 hypothetical protein CR47_0222365 [Ralstonia solanacearum]MDN4066161.1 hypothetical protein [Ralstonia solanacearum]
MSLSNEKLNNFAMAISQSATSKSESICTKIADEFEDELMDLEGLPQGPFEFIERLLTEPTLYRQPGVWNFLMVLRARLEIARRGRTATASALDLPKM